LSVIRGSCTTSTVSLLFNGIAYTTIRSHSQIARDAKSRARGLQWRPRVDHQGRPSAAYTLTCADGRQSTHSLPPNLLAISQWNATVSISVEKCLFNSVTHQMSRGYTAQQPLAISLKYNRIQPHSDVQRVTEKEDLLLYLNRWHLDGQCIGCPHSNCTKSSQARFGTKRAYCI
jgi:hypothetical protein